MALPQQTVMSASHGDRRPAPQAGAVVLVADDDAGMRDLLGVVLRAAPGVLAVVEAADGSEAVQLGLQAHPHVALLDLNMPRLNGIAAALTLRELVPSMQIALHSSDPRALREQAAGLDLPLFNKQAWERGMSANAHVGQSPPRALSSSRASRRPRRLGSGPGKSTREGPVSP